MDKHHTTKVQTSQHTSPHHNLQRMPISTPKASRSLSGSRTQVHQSIPTARTSGKTDLAKTQRRRLERANQMKKQTMHHKRMTKELLHRSELISKKMMLAVQNMENTPLPGMSFFCYFVLCSLITL
jgi:hypothetical protein